MSDGYGHSKPVTDADILTDDQVEEIISLIPPPFGTKLVRHMMAVVRKLAKTAHQRQESKG